MAPPSPSNVIQVNPVPWANEKDRERYIENDRSKFLTAEDYYNNKYPKRDITFSKVEHDRKNPNSPKPYTLYNVDVRTILNSKSFRLPEIRANPNYDDAIALEGLKWVMMKPEGENIEYTQLNDTGEIIPGVWQFSHHRIKDWIDDGTEQSRIEAMVLNSENWSFSYQTLGRGNGDCEDGAILLYDILRNAGIPAWKLRINAGFVRPDPLAPSGGHAWLSYYVESQFWKSKRDDKWVILDWCNGDLDTETKIEDRIRYTDDKRYFDIDFSFNEDYAWSLGKLRLSLQHFGDCPTIQSDDFYWRKRCTCGSKQCTCGFSPCKCGSKKCTCASTECTCPR